MHKILIKRENGEPLPEMSISVGLRTYPDPDGHTDPAPQINDYIWPWSNKESKQVFYNGDIHVFSYISVFKTLRTNTESFIGITITITDNNDNVIERFSILKENQEAHYTFESS